MSDFVNPYNFISLQEPKEENAKKPVGDYYPEDEELLSGKLSCRLIAKTPLIIPDNEKKRDREKGEGKWYNGQNYDEYPFMTENGIPMIPGSSIRGVIRSVYEAITNSCVFTNDDYYFSSRTNQAKEPKLLEKRIEDGKDVWYLHDAVRYADRIRVVEERGRRIVKPGLLPNSVMSGEKIKFSGHQAKTYGGGDAWYVDSCNKDGDQQTGYVMKMNKMWGKSPVDDTPTISGTSVFEQIPNCQPVELDEKFVKVFKENIKKYKESKSKSGDGSDKTTAGQKAAEYETLFLGIEKNGGMIPVWCETSEKSEKSDAGYYLALSQLSRNVYTRQPKDILPPSLQPCSSRKSLCPACALFGFVSQKGESDGNAMGGRVRFSDAWCEDKNMVNHESKLLPILSSPRSSSLEFYLRYKYNDRFYHADTDGVILSGRKFYWHHPKFDIDKIKGDEVPKQTQFYQYAEADAEFKFDVYFDRITQGQLNALYTALTLGENDKDSLLCQKFGHAKPVGFGSAKVVVDSAKCRTYAYGEYRVLELELTKEEVEAPEKSSQNIHKILPVSIPKELAIALDFGALEGQKIDYPRMEPGGPIFKWFAKNRPPSGQGKEAIFRTKLPTADSPVLVMPCNPTEKNRNDTITFPQPEEKKSPGVSIRVTQAQPKEETSAVQPVLKLKNPWKIALNASYLTPQHNKDLKDFIEAYDANPDIYFNFVKEYNKAKKMLK